MMLKGLEIKIQWKDKVYSISIGYDTLWFAQIPFIMIAEECYNHREVYYAYHIWQFPATKRSN